MKATIEFDLTEDKEKFQNAVDALNGKVPEYIVDALYVEVFRPMIKHGINTNSQGTFDLTPGEIDFVESIWQKVREHLSGED